MFKHRVNNIRRKLLREKLDAVFISSVANIAYLTGYANFSEREREAYLIITKDEQFIITDGRYAEAVKKAVPRFTLFERNHKNKIEDLLKILKKKIMILGIEEDELTVSEHKLLIKYFRKMKHFDLKKHRAIKTPDEIKKIEDAAKLGDKAFDYILKKIKPGISEKEIAFELGFFIQNNGVELSFTPIVAFGKNSSVPHHQTGQTVLGSGSKSGGEGQIILLDFGVKYQNYCSDMTRTIFFGKPTDRQKRIYETVLATQQKAIYCIKSAIQSGKKMKAAEVDKVARDYIASKGYRTIPHSLGHGIGLEVHEQPSFSPNSREILKEGMVFSIEPGIYLPDCGGVRIEDLYILEKQGLRQITNSSKKLVII